VNARLLATAKELVRIAPLALHDDRFALKGGTAINLFVRNLPRLSVDLDLVFVNGALPRAGALAAIAEGLAVAAERLRKAGYGVLAPRAADGVETRMIVSRGDVTVTVEVNHVIRGTVHPVRRAGMADTAKALLAADIELPLLATEEIYAGKLVAALDRQHPRDLFDVQQLLEHGGITPAIRRCFVAYLGFHNRPLHEVLFAPEKDIERLYLDQFAGMTADEAPLAGLLEARSTLLRTLPPSLDHAERRFLRTLVRGEPDFAALDFPHLAGLPAMQWKLENLRKLREHNRRKFDEQADELDRRLERAT
jgi:hypothetical protein